MTLEERKQKLIEEYGVMAVQEWRNDHPEMSDWFDKNQYIIEFVSDEKNKDEYMCASFEFDEHSIVVYLKEIPEICAEFNSNCASAYVEQETDYDKLAGQLEGLMKVKGHKFQAVVETDGFSNVPAEFRDSFENEQDIRTELENVLGKNGIFWLAEG